MVTPSVFSDGAMRGMFPLYGGTEVFGHALSVSGVTQTSDMAITGVTGTFHVQKFANTRAAKLLKNTSPSHPANFVQVHNVLS